MKKLFFALLASLIVTGVFAQAKVINDPNAEVRPVRGFHAIKVSTGIFLYLTQGNDEVVAVSASDVEYRSRIKTIVEDGVLKIYYDNPTWKYWDIGNKKLKVYVSCKTLDALKGSSGAQVKIDGTIKSNELNLDFSSGAMFDGRVEATTLSIDQSSGAESRISGTVSNCKVDASSGGVFKGYDLQTQQCDAHSSTGGSIRITVQKELYASAHTGGEIYYQGDGVIREISTGTGGEVAKR